MLSAGKWGRILVVVIEDGAVTVVVRSPSEKSTVSGNWTKPSATRLAK